MQEDLKYVLLSNIVLHVCSMDSSVVVWVPPWSTYCGIVASASYAC
jgi:hypothetical protein